MTKGLFYASLLDSVEFTCTVVDSMPLTSFEWPIKTNNDIELDFTVDIQNDVSTLLLLIKNVQKD